MGAIGTNEGNDGEPEANKEQADEDCAHSSLPAPRDGARFGEDDPPPAFVEVGVQPSKINDKFVGLRKKR